MLRLSGGDGGIRTHDRVTPIHTFQACAFDHSATSPHAVFQQALALATDSPFRKTTYRGSIRPMKQIRFLIAIPAVAIILASCAAVPKSQEAMNKTAITDPVSASSPKIAADMDAPKNVDGTYMAPSEIVAKAPAADWIGIAPSDLLVMDLAPLGDKPRRVVIQLMPAPFSQGWVGNIRKLAAAHFWDGTAIVRVQDNYVTQWGDPDGEDAVKAKKLPDGLVSVPESEYAFKEMREPSPKATRPIDFDENEPIFSNEYMSLNDAYVTIAKFRSGWAIGITEIPNGAKIAPVHCYGMVGVGRNLSPDTGTGAELYTVIGHAPRHLDRNIALVGRIIEGMEHMSSLPRGTGALGFYEKPEERTAILSVRLMSEMAQDKTLPTYEYLSTESVSFAKYADARANRRDPFFIKPAGGADICNIPVPVRQRKVP
jgi:peptidylprolyl isomerase